MVHVYWLEFKLESRATMALVFHAVKHAIKACFLCWHFLTTNISWGNFIIRSTFCLTYSYKQKSYYVVLFIDQTTSNPSLAQGLYEDWMELCNLSLALGSYENWMGYINGTNILILSYWAHTSYNNIMKTFHLTLWTK